MIIVGKRYELQDDADRSAYVTGKYDREAGTMQILNSDENTTRAYVVITRWDERTPNRKTTKDHGIVSCDTVGTEQADGSLNAFGYIWK